MIEAAVTEAVVEEVATEAEGEAVVTEAEGEEAVTEVEAVAVIADVVVAVGVAIVPRHLRHLHPLTLVGDRSKTKTLRWTVTSTY